MIQTVIGQAPVQILASNFSIGPSEQGYTLQISADGKNYSNLFSVGAGITRMVTGVANGSFYRLSGNTGEVSINWRTQCNDGQGGGGEGPQGPQGPAGINDFLNSTPSQPEEANEGDVFASPNGSEVISFASTTRRRSLWNGTLNQYNTAKRIVDMTAMNAYGIGFHWYRTSGYSGDEMLEYIKDEEVVNTWNLTSMATSSQRYYYIDPSIPGIGFDIKLASGRVALGLFEPTRFGTFTVNYTHGEEWTGTGPTKNDSMPSLPASYNVNDYETYQIVQRKMYIYDFAALAGTDSVNFDGDYVFATKWVLSKRDDATYTNSNVMLCDNGVTVKYNVTDDSFEITNPSTSEDFGAVSVDNPVSATVNDDTFIFTYDGKSLTWYSQNEAGYSWQRMYDEYIGKSIVALVDEDSNRLVPVHTTDDGDKVLSVNYWTNEAEWTSSYDIVNARIKDIPSFYDVNAGAVLSKQDDWNLEWKDLDTSKLQPVDTIPSTIEDGSVVAYTDGEGSYGIFQAQSGDTDFTWVSAEDGMTGWTECRVAYNGYNDFAFATETNQGGIRLAWNGSEWNDGDIQSTDGEFTNVLIDGDQVYVSCVRDGNYLVVTINMAATNTWNVDNTEVYLPGFVPSYANVVTSKDITKLVKISQSDYDALVSGGTVDSATFYIITDE